MHEEQPENPEALRARVARLEAALAPVGAALVEAHGMGIPDGAAAVRLTATEARAIREAHAGIAFDPGRELARLQEAVAYALFSRPDGGGYFLEPSQVTPEAVEGAAPLLQRVTVDVCEQLAADALAAAHESGAAAHPVRSGLPPR